MYLYFNFEQKMSYNIYKEYIVYLYIYIFFKFRNSDFFKDSRNKRNFRFIFIKHYLRIKTVKFLSQKLFFTRGKKQRKHGSSYIVIHIIVASKCKLPSIFFFRLDLTSWVVLYVRILYETCTEGVRIFPFQVIPVFK